VHATGLNAISALIRFCAAMSWGEMAGLGGEPTLAEATVNGEVAPKD
jgi:hypothetical protein